MMLRAQPLDESRPRSRRGYTLVELLVVIAIQGTVVTLLLPAVGTVRAKDNQTMGLADLRTIGTAQVAFRSLDADGDMIDDYGTLAELGAAGLINSALAAGQANVYGFSVALTPPSSPGFEARAIPVSSKPARLRFYLNEAGVETFSESGTPGPGSTALQPGDECTIPPNPACDQIIESTGFEALEALNLLTGADNVPGAIDFLAQEDPIPLMPTAFDANGDGSLGFEEMLSADLLNVARSVVSGLGLDPGPDIGDDTALRAILSTEQSDLGGILELDLDAPQPELLISDFPTDEGPVVTFLQAFLGVPPVPLLGPLGLALMALSLAVLALAALSGLERRRGTNRPL